MTATTRPHDADSRRATENHNERTNRHCYHAPRCFSRYRRRFRLRRTRVARRVVRRDLSHFPDRVSQAIDDERRDYFEHSGAMFAGENVLIATWFPPMLAQQKFVDLMYDDGENDAQKKSDRERTQKLLAEFKREILNLEFRLQSVFKLTRLRSYPVEQADGVIVKYRDLLRWLHRCLTGDNQPIRLPSEPAYLDYLIGGQELFVGITPNIGGKFIQCVSFDSFPLESYPNILNSLSQLSLEYRWSNRFIFLDRHEALARLEKTRKKWKQQERRLIDALLNNTNGRINQDAVSMVADIEAMTTETQGGLISTGYYSATIVLFDADLDRFDAAANTLKKQCAEIGFAAQIETVNSLEAFLGSLPGHGVENIRAPDHQHDELRALYARRRRFG
jgi:type IV secretion system protein VirB4